jgi:hypothetical protein
MPDLLVSTTASLLVPFISITPKSSPTLAMVVAADWPLDTLAAAASSLITPPTPMCSLARPGALRGPKKSVCRKGGGEGALDARGLVTWLPGFLGLPRPDFGLSWPDRCVLFGLCAPLIPFFFPPGLDLPWLCLLSLAVDEGE